MLHPAGSGNQAKREALRFAPIELWEELHGLHALCQDKRHRHPPGTVQKQSSSRRTIPVMVEYAANQQQIQHNANLRGNMEGEREEVTTSTDIKYRHTGEPNTYTVYYLGDLIGTVAYTPDSPGTWTFTNIQKNTATFGSTRLHTVGFYVEQFMKRGEGNGEKVSVIPAGTRPD